MTGTTTTRIRKKGWLEDPDTNPNCCGSSYHTPTTTTTRSLKKTSATTIIITTTLIILSTLLITPTTPSELSPIYTLPPTQAQSRHANITSFNQNLFKSLLRAAENHGSGSGFGGSGEEEHSSSSSINHNSVIVETGNNNNRSQLPVWPPPSSFSRRSSAHFFSDDDQYDVHNHHHNTSNTTTHPHHHHHNTVTFNITKEFRRQQRQNNNHPNSFLPHPGLDLNTVNHFLEFVPLDYENGHSDLEGEGHTKKRAVMGGPHQQQRRRGSLLRPFRNRNNRRLGGRRSPRPLKRRGMNSPTTTMTRRNGTIHPTKPRTPLKRIISSFHQKMARLLLGHPSRRRSPSSQSSPNKRIDPSAPYYNDEGEEQARHLSNNNNNNNRQVDYADSLSLTLPHDEHQQQPQSSSSSLPQHNSPNKNPLLPAQSKSITSALNTVANLITHSHNIPLVSKQERIRKLTPAESNHLDHHLHHNMRRRDHPRNSRRNGGGRGARRKYPRKQHHPRRPPPPNQHSYHFNTHDDGEDQHEGHDRHPHHDEEHDYDYDTKPPRGGRGPRGPRRGPPPHFKFRGLKYSPLNFDKDHHAHDHDGGGDDDGEGFSVASPPRHFKDLSPPFKGFKAFRPWRFRFNRHNRHHHHGHRPHHQHRRPNHHNHDNDNDDNGGGGGEHHPDNFPLHEFEQGFHKQQQQDKKRSKKPWFAPDTPSSEEHHNKDHHSSYKTRPKKYRDSSFRHTTPSADDFFKPIGPHTFSSPHWKNKKFKKVIDYDHGPLESYKSKHYFDKEESTVNTNENLPKIVINHHHNEGATAGFMPSGGIGMGYLTHTPPHPQGHVVEEYFPGGDRNRHHRNHNRPRGRDHLKTDFADSLVVNDYFGGGGGHEGRGFVANAPPQQQQQPVITQPGQFPPLVFDNFGGINNNGGPMFMPHQEELPSQHPQHQHHPGFSNQFGGGGDSLAFQQHQQNYPAQQQEHAPHIQPMFNGNFPNQLLNSPLDIQPQLVDPFIAKNDKGRVIMNIDGSQLGTFGNAQNSFYNSNESGPPPPPPAHGGLPDDDVDSSPFPPNEGGEDTNENAPNHKNDDDDEAPPPTRPPRRRGNNNHRHRDRTGTPSSPPPPPPPHPTSNPPPPPHPTTAASREQFFKFNHPRNDVDREKFQFELKKSMSSELLEGIPAELPRFSSERVILPGGEEFPPVPPRPIDSIFSELGGGGGHHYNSKKKNTNSFAHFNENMIVSREEHHHSHSNANNNIINDDPDDPLNNGYSTLPDNWSDFTPDPSHSKLPRLTYDHNNELVGGNSGMINSRAYKLKSALTPKGIMKAIMSRFPVHKKKNRGKKSSSGGNMNHAHTKFSAYDAKSIEDGEGHSGGHTGGFVWLQGKKRSRKSSSSRNKRPHSIQDIINSDSSNHHVGGGVVAVVGEGVEGEDRMDVHVPLNPSPIVSSNEKKTVVFAHRTSSPHLPVVLEEGVIGGGEKAPEEDDVAVAPATTELPAPLLEDNDISVQTEAPGIFTENIDDDSPGELVVLGKSHAIKNNHYRHHQHSISIPVGAEIQMGK